MLISRQSEEIIYLSESQKACNNEMVDYTNFFPTYKKNIIFIFMLTSLSNLSARFASQDIETEKRESTDKFNAEIRNKAEELLLLQKVSKENGHCVGSLQKQLLEMQRTLEDKDQSFMKCKQREKLLEEQIASVSSDQSWTCI